MEQEFNKGDRVTWKSHGGNAEGEVLRKITEDNELAGRTVRASKDDPQSVVRSDKSGGEAVHKPSAPTKKATTAKARSARSARSERSNQTPSSARRNAT
jgi:hypothetical protein